MDRQTGSKRYRKRGNEKESKRVGKSRAREGETEKQKERGMDGWVNKEETEMFDDGDFDGDISHHMWWLTSVQEAVCVCAFYTAISTA